MDKHLPPTTDNRQPREAKLLMQGAEAKIFLSKETIIKDRTPKSYRHPALDKQIRTRRTRSEAKILTKAKSIGANVPNLIHTEKHILTIEYIPGDRLSQTLNSYTEKKQLSTMQKLGHQTAKLHSNNIIHSDLTTSNTILSNSKIFLIDFGLSFISTKIEDKAVDLHLIKQALEAKHFRSPDHLLGQNAKKLFTAFKKGYRSPDSKKTLERLETVEQRGRYKRSK